MALEVTICTIVSHWNRERVLWKGEAASVRDGLEKARERDRGELQTFTWRDTDGKVIQQRVG